MTDIERQIQQRVAAFVTELTGLVREAALAAVMEALRSGGRVAGSGGGARQAAAAVRAKGQKRPPEEIEAAAQQVHAWVTENPGHGIEDIARALGQSTKTLTLPLRKLTKAGAVVARGQKRATKYFPGSGEAAARRRGRGAGAKRGSRRRG